MSSKYKQHFPKSQSSKADPVDSGYGWFVVAGAFLIHVFVDGFVYSFGVIANSLIKEFNVSNTEMSVVLSLVVSFMLGTGPVASYVCNKVGFRITAVIGALIASTGCAISYFASSVLYLIFSVGVVMGIGFGFMYCTAIVIVTLYFDRYRSLATGITVCGAGIGTFIFSRVIGLLIVNFGWRMVFLIYTGFILICVPCALLFRPIKLLQNHKFERLDEKEDKLNAENRNAILSTQKSFDSSIVPTMTTPAALLAIVSSSSVMEGSLSSIDCSVNRMNESNSSVIKTDQQELSSKQLSSFSSLSLFSNPVYLLFAIANFLISIGFDSPPLFMPLNANIVLGADKIDASATVSIFGLANTLGRITFGLLCDRQLPFSWGRDRAMNRFYIFGISVLLCGFASCFTFLLPTYNWFMLYCFVFGFLISTFVCLTSVVLVDLIGVDHIANAFGLLLFVQGLATLLGPPLAGWLYDLTHRYDWTFAFCGICLILGSVVFCFILFVPKRVLLSPKN